MLPGDHLKVFRGFYWHHGIHLGDGEVIHYTGTPLNMSEARVEREDIEVFADGGNVEIVRYSRAFSREKTVERARSRRGEQDYNLVFNNCEHFARWCRTGEHRSEQVEFATGVAAGPAGDATRKAVEQHFSPTAAAGTSKGGGLGDAVADMFTQDVIEPYTGDGVDRELTTGKKGSVHSKNSVTGKSIPGAQLTRQANMLGTATLAVGVANLGVGIYNAYQIHQTQEKVESSAKKTRQTARREAARTRGEVREVKQALTAGFTEVKNVLEYQNGLLHAIEEVQKTHGRKLDAIMHGLLEGFDTIEERIESVTRKRRNDEYLERLSGLHLAKRDIAEALQFEGSPSEGECRTLEDKAGSFQSWLEGRLRSSDLHPLARQPLIFAKIEARMSRIDGMMFRNPDRYAPRAQGRIDEMRTTIRHEVQTLHDDATPWEVATILRDQVRNYVTLHRSLARSRELFGDEETRAEQMEADVQSDTGAAIQVAPWDDPLPVLSSIGSEEESSDAIELKTLHDFEWVVRAFDLDPSETDLRQYDSVSASALARRLGAEELNASFDEVRPLVMPEPWERYGREIQSEFGFEPGVGLEGGEAVEAEEVPTSQRSSELSEDVPFWQEVPYYDSVDRLYLRENRDTYYRFAFHFRDERYKILLMLKDGRATIAIFSAERLVGNVRNTPTTTTRVDRGELRFSLPFPGESETWVFKLRSKSKKLRIDPDGAPFLKRNRRIIKELREYRP